MKVKKIISVLLVGALVLTMVAGCGGTGTKKVTSQIDTSKTKPQSVESLNSLNNSLKLNMSEEQINNIADVMSLMDFRDKVVVSRLIRLLPMGSYLGDVQINEKADSMTIVYDQGNSSEFNAKFDSQLKKQATILVNSLILFEGSNDLQVITFSFPIMGENKTLILKKSDVETYMGVDVYKYLQDEIPKFMNIYKDTRDSQKTINSEFNTL